MNINRSKCWLVCVSAIVFSCSGETCARRRREWRHRKPHSGVKRCLSYIARTRCAVSCTRRPIALTSQASTCCMDYRMQMYYWQRWVSALARSLLRADTASVGLCWYFGFREHAALLKSRLRVAPDSWWMLTARTDILLQYTAGNGPGMGRLVGSKFAPPRIPGPGCMHPLELLFALPRHRTLYAAGLFTGK